MLIICVRDNKNNRWKRNAETKRQQQQQQKNRTRGTEAIAKGWEINDFVEQLS